MKFKESQYRKYSVLHIEYMFKCPACNRGHKVQTKGNGPCWKMKGLTDRATIDPSIKIRKDGYVCHSKIFDGMIYFYEDSTHGLRGKTVNLPNW